MPKVKKSSVVLEHVSGPLEIRDSHVLNAWSRGLLPCGLLFLLLSLYGPKCMASDRADFFLSVFLYLPGVSGVST